MNIPKIIVHFLFWGCDLSSVMLEHYRNQNAPPERQVFTENLYWAALVTYCFADTTLKVQVKILRCLCG